MDQSFLNVRIRGDSMWPSYKDGDTIECKEYKGGDVFRNDIIVFTHPFKSDTTCVKRVKRVTDDGIFVEGDNPDPLSSEDSHNFGLVKISSIIAIKVA